MTNSKSGIEFNVLFHEKIVGKDNTWHKLLISNPEYGGFCLQLHDDLIHQFDDPVNPSLLTLNAGQTMQFGSLQGTFFKSAWLKK